MGEAINAVPATALITKPKVWSLSDLPELKVGDNLAFKAEGWEKLAVAIIGARTFHWAMAGERQVDDSTSLGDYSVFDSTSKGVTAHLLSEYQTRDMRVYRPKMIPALQEILKPWILKRCYYYGFDRYDFKGVFLVAIWCLLRKLGFNVEWWVHNSSRFWCLEFNNTVWRDLGYPIVPDVEPPYPQNFEKSPALELIWATF